MNGNEVINGLLFFKEKLYNGIFRDRISCFDDAIKDIEQLQKYREIGTVEELKKAVKEEDVLKFYYCESEEDYYIGKRAGNFYYARYGKTGFEWFMSRYLPWGKEGYPTEPMEISCFDWLCGFFEKYINHTERSEAE